MGACSAPVQAIRNGQFLEKKPEGRLLEINVKEVRFYGSNTVERIVGVEISISEGRDGQNV
jgi:hypothetical protein